MELTVDINGLRFKWVRALQPPGLDKVAASLTLAGSSVVASKETCWGILTYSSCRYWVHPSMEAAIPWSSLWAWPGGSGEKETDFLPKTIRAFSFCTAKNPAKNHSTYCSKIIEEKKEKINRSSSSLSYSHNSTFKIK